MLKLIVLVGAGGAVGSICRFLIAHWLKPSGHFPLATLTVNIAGCLLIGWLLGTFATAGKDLEWRALLVAGFCGGFTTFSAFSYETWILIEQRRTTVALLYVIVSLLTCVIATALGLYLSRKVL